MNIVPAPDRARKSRIARTRVEIFGRSHMVFSNPKFLFGDIIDEVVWGPYLLVLLLGTGIYLSVRLGFFQITGIKLWWSGTFGHMFSKQNRRKEKGNNISPFRAVMTSMAATVGTGNIVGVATAIYSGGPGAVFWMWISGFFGMMTKYSEIILAVKYRGKDKDGTHRGGPMYYMEKGLNMKWLAVIYAVLGVLATLGTGNLTQSNAISQAVNAAFGVPVVIIGITLAVLCALVILGGIKRIASFSAVVVPFMVCFYIVGSLIALISNAAKLPEAFSLIIREAFSLRAAGGGIAGYVIMKAMRFGFARGVFSNEAGLGTASMAHSVSYEKEPVRQGFWGLFEVFLDTIVINTLSALIFIVFGLYGGSIQPSGMTLAMTAFIHAFGSGFGPVFMSFIILCFAGSTIISWSYYGQQCLGYLTRNNKTVSMVYKIAFCGLIIVGSLGGMTFFWELADIFNGLMAIPNLIALLLLSRVITSVSKEYLAARKHKKLKE